MRHFFITITCIVIAAIILTDGCNATPPPEFSNNWKSVNGFTNQIVPIQMYRPYEYRALDIDVTLKSLIARWAEDSLLTSQYHFCFNYTLPKEVENIRSRDLDNAIEQLNEIYKDYPIKIILHRDSISVEYDFSKDKNNIIHECGG